MELFVRTIEKAKFTSKQITQSYSDMKLIRYILALIVICITILSINAEDLNKEKKIEGIYGNLITEEKPSAEDKQERPTSPPPQNKPARENKNPEKPVSDKPNLETPKNENKQPPTANPTNSKDSKDPKHREMNPNPDKKSEPKKTSGELSDDSKKDSNEKELDSEVKNTKNKEVKPSDGEDPSDDSATKRALPIGRRDFRPTRDGRDQSARSGTNKDQNKKKGGFHAFKNVFAKSDASISCTTQSSSLIVLFVAFVLAVFV